MLVIGLCFDLKGLRYDIAIGKEQMYNFINEASFEFHQSS